MNTVRRITFERILCLTDLSEGSNESLRYGVALARAYQAKLLVCHCATHKALAEPSSRRQIENLLRSSVHKHIRIPDSCKLDWEALIIEGEPTLAIPQEAARQRADLIVLRSRRRPVAAALLGSTAEALCRTAPCPVLVTHPQEHEWAGVTCNEIDLKRVLVAVDFSPESEMALASGLALAQEYQAELHLIHILSPHALPSEAEITSLPISAEKRFEDIGLKLQDIVPKETYLWCEVKQAVREGDPHQAVLDYAAENDIDLICIGASGAGTRIQEMLGSTVNRVLRHAPCPVFLARPIAASASAA
jgi:nucleotide-binding universal stress UspA family protein